MARGPEKGHAATPADAHLRPAGPGAAGLVPAWRHGRVASAGSGAGREDLMYEIIIHLVFIVSALLLAWIEHVLAITDKITASFTGAAAHNEQQEPAGDHH